MKVRRWFVFGAGIALGFIGGMWLSTAVYPAGAQDTPAEYHWLPSDLRLAMARAEDHLRGYDVAMFEVGHRFNELYDAGQRENWPLAEYQLEKIELAIRLAMERRPARTPSATPFLDDVLPAVTALVKEHDASRFSAAMERLRTGCMQCHVQEDVPHFIVQLPEDAGALSLLRAGDSEGR